MTQPSWVNRRSLATLAVLAVVGQTAAVAGSAISNASPGRAAGPMVTAGAKPTLPGGAQATGPLSTSKTIHGVVGFTTRNAALLHRYASGVSKPGSVYYHRYLSPAAYRTDFGATAATINATTADLRAQGLTVKPASANGMMVQFSGSAATVSKAFGTSFESYRLRGGRTAYANTSAVKLPSSIAPSVQTVLGLNNLVRPQATPQRPTSHTARAAKQSASAAAIKNAAQPCTAVQSAATSFGDYTFDQLAHSYGLDPLYQKGDLGAGQTIALYEQDAFTRNEINHFDTCYFGASAAAGMMSRLTLHNVNGGYAKGPGSEAPLDIEDLSALAPKADIQVWEAPPTYQDGFVEESDMINQDQAQFLSESYGSCEPELEAEYPGVLQLENSLFEQAAAQGETFLSSSADNGSDTCSADSGQPVAPLLSVSDPASQPFVPRRRRDRVAL